MRQKNIFLTGITGFVGSFLARDLINAGYRVFGLARAGKGISAYERVIDALKFAYGDEWQEELVVRNLKILDGDIIYPHLGIKFQRDEKELIKNIDIIIHSAALAELNCEYPKIKKINVDGTKHVLAFAMKCKDEGRLKKFNHISTMYVAGKNLDFFDESMLEEGQEFNNTYERSKFESEKVVRLYQSEGLNCSIFRPSMIVGDSISGKTSNFRLVYQPLHFFSKGVYDVFPADLDGWQNFIHIDTVTKIITALAANDNFEVYHVVSPNDTSIRDFIGAAKEFFGIKMPIFKKISQFDLSDLTPAKRALAKQFQPYFSYHVKFNAKKSFRRCGSQGVSFPKFEKENLYKIFEYCVNEEFISTNKMFCF